jgi:hypothetical protein
MANPLRSATPTINEFGDMPRGQSEEDRASRVRYWLDRGNRELAKAGRTDLEWKCVNGHYFIDPR